MFFILSKVLFYLVMPITWIFVAFFWAFFSKKEKNRKRALATGLGLLIFFTNPFLSNEALLLWEVPPTPIEEVGEYDAAIILTGISNQEKTPKDRIYIGRGADRVLHPLQLYRMGKVKSFFISGGSGSLTGKSSTEAAEIKRILLMAGVPENLIITEERSRNTHENAQFTQEQFKKTPQLKKLLLVTSAFHLRRAKGCFNKEGLQPDIFATDFYTTNRSFTPDRLFIPQEAALNDWQKLIHEILGYIIYDLVGYL